ncbi:hypothetical protein BGZ81_008019 [Podila clonocystis]|nr:hypothetical protein BGZ81_008019 [Podila clonocystis]
MLANKTFRPIFIAAAAVIMLLAIVEAAPTADALRCVICDEPPDCNLPCRNGYCEINWCTCRPKCRTGIPP